MTNFAVDALESQVDALHRENERLKAALNRFLELDIHDSELADNLWCIQQEEAPHDTNLHEHDAHVIEQLRFPTMLRKMWSGTEVQQWLLDEASRIRSQGGVNHALNRKCCVEVH
jgi:hypothetical protein